MWRMNRAVYAVVNTVAVQATWFAAVLGGAAGHWWPGALAALVTVAVHLGVVPGWRHELLRVLIAGLFGIVLDSLLTLAGLLSINGGLGDGRLSSWWMVALWCGFATSLAAGLRVLTRLPWWANAGIGAVSGAVAYFGGSRLGALHFAEPMLLGVGGVALAWALALPLMVRQVRPEVARV